MIWFEEPEQGTKQGAEALNLSKVGARSWSKYLSKELEQGTAARS